MLDVYKTRYKLQGNPFRLTPDYGCRFSHDSYANAIAYLKYGVFQGEGFVAITGGPGTGKTTLINQLLAELANAPVTVGLLTAAQLDSRNLLNLVARAFGLHTAAGSEPGPAVQLEEFLKRQSQRGRRTVLIVDEAQGLSPRSLEALRLLSNFQANDHLLLQIFLVGQRPLLARLQISGMEQLRQRVIAAAHLEPLDFDETVSYVEHRLWHVGWRGDPAFREGALRLIHKSSGGVPRQINLICHRLFLSGGLQGKHEFGAEDALGVIEELRNEGLLGAEAPGDDTVDEKLVARPDDGETPVRSLPRPGRFAVPEQPRHSARPLAPDEPEASLAAKIQATPGKGENKSESHAAVRLRREQQNAPATRVNAGTGVHVPNRVPAAAADDRAAVRAPRTKPSEPVDERLFRRWRGAAVGALVVCLAVVIVMETPISRQVLSLLSVGHTAGSTRSGQGALESAVQGEESPGHAGGAKTNGASPERPTGSAFAGSVRRDSSAAGMAPDRENVTVVRPIEKQAPSSDIADGRGTHETLVVSEDRNVSQPGVVNNTAAADLEDRRFSDAGSATEQAAVEVATVRVPEKGARGFAQRSPENENVDETVQPGAGVQQAPEEKERDAIHADSAEESDVTVQPVPPAGVKAPQRVCETLGPFLNKRDATALSTRLVSSGYVAKLRDDKLDELVGFRVYLPAMEAAAAQRIVADLDAHGMNDYYVGAQNLIWLGVFSGKDTAERRLREVERLGYEPLLDKRFRTRDAYWLDIEGGAALLDSEVWEDIQARQTDVRVVRASCG